MLKTIQVLYEDDHYVAFNKPAGLLVVPTPKKEKNTLTDIVNAHHCPSSDSGQDASNRVRLYPCHRLDRETSGVILFAKGKKNEAAMAEEFKAGRVKKKYIAFVRGRLKNRQGTITQPVRDFHEYRRVGGKGARVPVGPGHPAQTAYQVVDEEKGFSVVEVYPKTGRTHQIRIHFQQMGHPLLGERLYAHGRDFSVNFRRLALHAAELSWMHPVMRKTITVKAPLPADMQEFWGHAPQH